MDEVRCPECVEGNEFRTHGGHLDSHFICRKCEHIVWLNDSDWFGLCLRRLLSLRFPRRSESQNHMPPTSARADTARIRGIGKRSRNLWGLSNPFETPAPPVPQHHGTKTAQSRFASLQDAQLT